MSGTLLTAEQSQQKKRTASGRKLQTVREHAPKTGKHRQSMNGGQGPNHIETFKGLLPGSAITPPLNN